jgi:hypothetical protein
VRSQMVSPAAWTKLASELLEHGIESEYLARVSARVTPEQRLELLEVEIGQEIAGALGRTEDKLNLALAELELQRARYDRAVRAGSNEAERAAFAEAFNAQRNAARARLRDLQIHREAVGFRRNQILNELYPIPAKLER